MLNVNCEACEDIKQTDPSLIVNGWSDSECASMKNDTGLVASSGHNDCQDLTDMNDCLIGNEDAELEKYDTCDWKKFMHRFIPNLWTLQSAIICAICGIWTNIHALWEEIRKIWAEIEKIWAEIQKIWNKIGDILAEINRIWQKINQLIANLDKLLCIVNNMGKGSTFTVGEEPSAGSYVVAGKGVSFYQTGTVEHSNQIYIIHVGGGLAIISGSCKFYKNDFTDARACVNFDNGSTERTSTSRLGNSHWDITGRDIEDGELIFEVRIKKSQYPQIQGFFRGNGIESSGGSYKVRNLAFNEGSYAYGQHGGCDANGNPFQVGADSGHLVPSGWIYIQCRMSWIDDFKANGDQYTPYGWMGIRFNNEEIDC